MRVHIGTDHAGFDLKRYLIDALTEDGHEVVDHGPYEYDAEDDYPVFCIPAAEAVVADPGSLCIVIGGSGNGEQIAANKVRGARAALCNDLYTARLSRQHNDANVLVLGGRLMGAEMAADILHAWLEADFAAGRHARRVDKIADIERRHPEGRR